MTTLREMIDSPDNVPGAHKALLIGNVFAKGKSKHEEMEMCGECGKMHAKGIECESSMEAGGPGSGRRPGYGTGKTRNKQNEGRAIVKQTLSKLGERYPNGQFVKPVSDSRIHSALMRNFQRAGHTITDKGKYPNGTRYFSAKKPGGSERQWQVSDGDVY